MQNNVLAPPLENDAATPPSVLGIVFTLAVCSLILLVDGFDTQSIAFAAPSIAADLEVGRGAFGLIFGAGLAGSLLGAGLLGAASDRLGHRRVLIAAIACFACASFATAHAGTILQLSFWRFVTGIGVGGAVPSTIAIAARCAPESMRATILTGLYACYPLGAVIGGSMSTAIIERWGWQGIFYLGAVSPLLLIPALLLIRPVEPAATDAPAEPDRPGERRMGILRLLNVEQLFSHELRRTTAFLWLACFFGLVLAYLLVNWLPLLLTSAGVGMNVSIYATVLLNLGSIVGSLTLGFLTDRFGVAKTLVPSFIVGGAMVVLLGVMQGNTHLVLVMATIVGALCIGAQITTYSNVVRFYPASLSASGVGWALAVGRAGSLLGPVGAGFLVAGGMESREVLFVAAVPALIAGLALAGLRRKPGETTAADPAEG